MTFVITSTEYFRIVNFIYIHIYIYTIGKNNNALETNQPNQVLLWLKALMNTD